MYPLIALGAAIAIWAIVAAAIGVDLIVPSVGATMRALGKLLAQGSFYAAVGGTILRSAAAYAICFVAAICTAAAAARCKPIARLLAPIVAISRVVPTMSIILLAVLWFAPQVAPIPVACVVIYPMLHTSLHAAIVGVDPQLCEMARAYRVPMRTQIRRLYLPEMLPSVWTAVRSTLGLTLKLIIAAEVLAQTRAGMGLHMQLSKVYLDTAQLFAWTLVAVALGAALEGIAALCLRATQRRRYAD